MLRRGLKLQIGGKTGAPAEPMIGASRCLFDRLGGPVVQRDRVRWSPSMKVARSAADILCRHLILEIEGIG
jgi:hypothetical protein